MQKPRDLLRFVINGLDTLSINNNQSQSQQQGQSQQQTQWQVITVLILFAIILIGGVLGGFHLKSDLKHKTACIIKTLGPKRGLASVCL